jgi:hypothetical protein
MALVVVGVVLTILGIGGDATLEMAVGPMEVKASSAGLGIMAAGAALSGGVAMSLPENVEVFGPTPRTLGERLRSFAPALLGLAVLAVIGLVISVVV